MRALILSVWFCSALMNPHVASADESWSLHADGPGLYTLEFDSTRTKSTVVEFNDRIYLLEVSLSARGGGTDALTEHREGGESILRTLDEEFPDKPLAAVLHSHWHPHSLASVAPFLERDIPLITTEANFDRVKEFIDPALLESKRSLIRFVEGDRMTLGSGDETIVAHRLLHDDYGSLPTPDYLFFEIPSRGAMHTGCMYSISRSGPVAGREVIPGRAIDVHAFIEKSGLELDGLVRVYLDSDEENVSEIIPVSRLEHTIATGVTVAELADRFGKLDAGQLRAQRDRLIRETIADGVPASILNGLVYQELAKKDLEKARELALLQALLSPSNANAWDTLGEVHYFLGELEVARAYEQQSRAIDPDFDGGGELVWERQFDEFQRRWAASAEKS